MIDPDQVVSHHTHELLLHRTRDLLEAHWDDHRGWCVPNPGTYPHLWLWDSCFHAIVWASLGDSRSVRELQQVVSGRTASGLVPHMRYGPAGPDTFLGPLSGSSSLTQPPVFGHAARVLAHHGFEVPVDTITGMRQAYDWLWQHRRTESGLLFIVHPWEAGNDHSPRWDDWGAPGRTRADYDRSARSAWNKQRMRDVRFADDGSAVWSTRFVAAPVSFNAYSAFCMAELAQLTGDTELADRARALSRSIDEVLWNPNTGLWSDLAVVGGGDSVHAPISDGVMGALTTQNPAKANAALDQLRDPDRFGAPFGPANVARTDPAYDPDMYWRGPAWPPLNYLFHQALLRWGRDGEADEVAEMTAAAALRSNFAEYWNPETAVGRGAAPQTWTGLALPMLIGSGPRPARAAAAESGSR